MSRYELCSTCRKAAKHVIQAYWGPLLCPWCCRQTAEKYDLLGTWPETPWEDL